jgi:hypothetical protein
VSPAFCIEISALDATIIHFSSEEVGENGAGGKNSSKHRKRKKSIGKAFHLSASCSAPAFGKRVEIAAPFFEQTVAY